MKSIAVIFTIIIVGVLCQNRHNRQNPYNSDIYETPQEQPDQANKKHNKNNNQENDYVKMDDEENDHGETFQIPTLMGPFKSIGLLDDIEQSISDKCFAVPECDSSNPFRTIDGLCNNLQFPVWGQSHTSIIRIIQGDYSDGVSKPRKAVSGNELPNARLIRTTILKDVDKQSPKYNLLLMQFGQMVAHDTVLNKKKLNGGSVVECCNPDGSSLTNLPENCLKIKAPQDDPFPNKRCLSAPRVADTADQDCLIRPVRQQLAATSFIDASLLYGSDDKTAKPLRSFVDGKLKKQLGPNGKSFLPNVAKASKVCNVAKDNTVCYVTGDGRINQLPGLAVITISLLRLHNYLCDEFMKINPQWNDERLYQESRRLLIAMYQHVTYNEFIPIILGKDYAKGNKLLPIIEGYDDRYDVNLNPTTLASFTAASFRALHSNIQGFIEMFNEGRKMTGKLRLRDFFLRVDIVQSKDNYDSFYRGLLTQNTQGQDQYYTKEVSEFLHKKPNQTDGMDLPSLDLERGRDYGLPSYNKYRQLCGLNKARSFKDLNDQISRENIDLLASVYEHVDDIDYYVGGLLEKPRSGGIFGHTFQCINGEMFYRWKFGDRFFYEFGNQAGSFTLNQLQEIRKTTMSLLVCLTSDIQSIQQNAFELLTHRNPLVSCKNISKLNLFHWKEDDSKY